MTTLNFFLALSLMTALDAQAENDKWTPLLSAKHLQCTKTHPCEISEDHGKLRFSIRMVTKDDLTKNLRSLERLQIVNSQTGEIQDVSLPNITRVDLDEPFAFYSLDLRENGSTDLALRFFPSLKLGDLYYYLTYKQDSKNFVLTPEGIPKLNRTKGEAKLQAVDFPDLTYHLSDDLQLKPDKSDW